MSFDPFGDFETRGYLRNVGALKDPGLVKRGEQRAFLDNLREAVETLGNVPRIAYGDVLDAHRILFGDFYPWAGQDRSLTAPNKRISKGGVVFAQSRYAQAAVEYALTLAQDHGAMRMRPGEVIGYLAHGHPFLEGNGRVTLLVANELAHRTGVSIDWSRTDKAGYLRALTEELADPGKGKLDAYLAPHIGEAMSRESTMTTLSGLRGLSTDAAKET